MPQRLELVPTPRRGRHPLVYGAAFFLMLSLAMLLFSRAIVWVVLTAGLAILMAVIAFLIALRGSRAPDR